MIRSNLVYLSNLTSSLYNGFGLYAYGIAKAFTLAIYDARNEDVAAHTVGFRCLDHCAVGLHSLLDILISVLVQKPQSKNEVDPPRVLGKEMML